MSYHGPNLPSSVWHPYTQMKTMSAPLLVRSGKGVMLELEGGRKLIDCISSWWVTLHGHAQPEIAEAIYQQALQLEQVIYAGLTHEPAERLAHRLIDLLPEGLTHVFYSDDGSTSVEVGLKMAFQYWKNLGIIGFGRIGSTVGQMAAAFGMRIIACCDFNIPETIRIIGGELMMMEDIIEKADFIAVHTPLTEKTRGMINKETIARMKDGVYLISTARGGIIDETALLEALNSGKVAGAALDVFENEPPTNMELIKHPHLIATPHIAGQTSEAQKRASVDIAREVLAALKGEKLHWKIV